MDLEVLELLINIGKPIRWPTATWLVMDVFDIVSIEAKDIIGRLIDAKQLNWNNGGWLEVNYEI